MGAWPTVTLHTLAVRELLPDTKKRLHAPPFIDVGLRPTSSRKFLPWLPGAENSLCHSL